MGKNIINIRNSQFSEDDPDGVFQQENYAETTIGLPFRVVLFNDDWHTFEEVIVQLIKAVSCSFNEARSWAFEVHVKGKAIVFSGPMEGCLRVTSVLEEIALNTQIVSDE